MNSIKLFYIYHNQNINIIPFHIYSFHYGSEFKVLGDNFTNPFEGQDPWKYSDSFELRNPAYLGTLTLYKGGGYAVNFKRTANKTLTV